MVRFSFIRFVPFLAFALVCLGLCAEAKPRLAFQVYGVRELCEKDFVGTLKAAKEIGFEGVETGRFYGCDAPKLKALCADAGLELVALQLYPDTLVEPELAKTIAFCRDCGCRRINVAWFKGSAENLRDWRLLVNVLNHAAEVCAREGITIGYHNHDQEFLIQHEGRSVCDWLFKNFSPLVKQEFDPGWCVLAGGDPVKWLDAHPGRNPTIHVMPAIRPDAKLVPGKAAVGSAADQADWPRILAAAEKGGTEWLVVKPTLFPAQLDDLKASYAFLKGLSFGAAEEPLGVRLTTPQYRNNFYPGQDASRVAERDPYHPVFFATRGEALRTLRALPASRQRSGTSSLRQLRRGVRTEKTVRLAAFGLFKND